MSRKSKLTNAAEIAAVEKLTVETQVRIHQLMLERGVSRAALASRLGCSKARVTQLFGDHANLTLETVARVFHALGEEPRVTSDLVDAIVARIKREVAQGAQGSNWRFRPGKSTPERAGADRRQEAAAAYINEFALWLDASTSRHFVLRATFTATSEPVLEAPDVYEGCVIESRLPYAVGHRGWMQ